MSLRRRIGLSCVLIALAAGCRDTPQSHPVTPPTPRMAPVAGEITVEQLARLLPRRAIAVGFDLDDTLIDSAAQFSALSAQYDPHVIYPPNYDDLTYAQQVQYHEFWNRLNAEFTDHSSAKSIARKLIAMHLARDDDIWIITDRPAVGRATMPTTQPTSNPTTNPTTFPTIYSTTAPADDGAKAGVEKLFGIVLKNPTIYTQLADKTRFISAHKIQYYYGDSDKDMVAANAASAVPIRVKRAADSTATSPAHPGQLGEAVLAGSDR